MFKVFASGTELYRCASIEDACSFALALYRSANVPVSITVYDCDGESNVLTFNVVARVPQPCAKQE